MLLSVTTITTLLALSTLSVAPSDVFGFLGNQSPKVDLYLPENYEELPAQWKLSMLWQKMMDAEGTTGKLPSNLQFAKFLFSDLNPVCDHFKDTSPFKGIKTVHPIGTVAKARFDFTGIPEHQFTGLFKGCDNVILRLSLAVTPKEDKMTPGIAVKFLRHDIPSANFVAMYSVDGQVGSGNFFLNEFRNHIPEPTQTGTKILAEKFKRVDPFPEYVGLSHLAETDATGKKIETPVFPFEIIMVPNADLTAKYEDAKPQDDLATMLNQIEEGTKLYDLFARASPESSERIPLGAIITTSPMISSANSDEFLFFRHQRMTEDFNLKPEWKPKKTSEFTNSVEAGSRLQLVRQDEVHDLQAENESRPQLVRQDEVHDLQVEEVEEQKKCPFSF